MTYLIACGRSKGTAPAKARDFYVGAPTQRVLAEAEAQGPTLILSALHGLVDPDAVIAETYDVALDDLSDPEYVAWIEKVRAQLVARGIAADELEYVGSAPAYADAVAFLKGDDEPVLTDGALFEITCESWEGHDTAYAEDAEGAYLAYWTLHADHAHQGKKQMRITNLATGEVVIDRML